MKILELDQWSSTATNISEFNFSNFDFTKLYGGDSEAAKGIFGGHFDVREVKETDSPSISNVWFMEENGKLKLWKYNYDSSD